jgi:hypothetical protein
MGFSSLNRSFDTDAFPIATGETPWAFVSVSLDAYRCRLVETRVSGISLGMGFPVHFVGLREPNVGDARV